MKALIVDSNQEDAEIAASVLKIPWPEVEIKCCEKGEMGLAIAAKSDFDLIYADLMLPDISGFEFLKRLSLFSNKPILVCKKGLTDLDIVRSLQLGVDECFLKPINQIEFIAKSQAVMRRYLDKEGKSIVIGAIKLDAETHRVYIHKNEILLTRNENLALYRLMENHGRTTSYTSLGRAIWGDDNYYSCSAIRTCVQRLARKLNTPLVNIVTERSAGYRLVLHK